MAEVLAILLHVNLALAVAVVAVLALRLPVRALFGARIAYGLWSLPPLAALAMLAPARVVTVRVAAASAVAEPAGPIAQKSFTPVVATFDPQPLLVGLWLAGVIASLAWLAWRQVQFFRAARAGRAGPAVVGVLRPRVVTPADFAQRYTPREREIVLAHEQAHLARRDPPVNATVALLVCICWFNPAVHVLSRWLRIDQELACDARVVAAHPKARRVYAEAMLKTQLAARPLPLGCHWAAHPLAQRVRLLSRPLPSQARLRAGGVATALMAIAASVGAWAVRPAQVVLAFEAAKARPASAIVAASAAPRAAPLPHHAFRPIAPIKAVSPQTIAAPLVAEAPPQPVIDPAGPDLRPPRLIRAVADRSLVQPGSAVRVTASGIAPDGAPLWADFTAFGSQHLYRKGAYKRSGSRYSLFTSVYQDGERLRVTVSLGKGFRPDETAAIELDANQSGVVRLPTGQLIAVSTMVRPETPEEVEEGRFRSASQDGLS